MEHNETLCESCGIYEATEFLGGRDVCEVCVETLASEDNALLVELTLRRLGI
jgi:hypothetical protein